MSNPLVSVIIPTFNRVDGLRATLDSLVGQTFPPDRYTVYRIKRQLDAPLAVY